MVASMAVERQNLTLLGSWGADCTDQACLQGVQRADTAPVNAQTGEWGFMCELLPLSHKEIEAIARTDATALIGKLQCLQIGSGDGRTETRGTLQVTPAKTPLRVGVLRHIDADLM